ncbi:MAG TPA: UDP-glucose/GDP-mannose dehydrogenase family protein [Rhizobiales bacterium]|nr:UDP-glucose/GDP-mannose dehydrogenase family protein [Hyphomicrobiales bacterium]
MQISVIGTGYVGLVSGACFSEFGFDVTCVDKDAEIVARLERDEIPIYEPGLDDLVHKNRLAGRLHFTTDLAVSVKDADAVFIAVGTPSRRGDGAADLVYVESAAREIAANLQDFTVIVTKSTVPVGTARHIERIVREANPAADFEMASNPEFLREGSAIEDFMRPDRVIVGVEGERARDILSRLYRPLSLRDAPVLFTGLESAELIKYAGNAFLATKITYINQISDLCESVGANVQDVAKGIGLDGRIGAKFLHPGPGFGGSCFPKDTRALSVISREAGAPMSLVDAVVDSNDKRKQAMAGRIIEALGGDAGGKRIGILGVSFKPNTDDMRESPSLDIIPELIKAGAQICAFDPAAMEKAAGMLPGVDWKDNSYAVAEDADCLVILTEWNEFRALDLQRLSVIMKQPVLIDLRNIYTLEEIAPTSFTYHSVGRSTLFPERS